MAKKLGKAKINSGSIIAIFRTVLLLEKPIIRKEQLHQIFFYQRLDTLVKQLVLLV